VSRFFSQHVAAYEIRGTAGPNADEHRKVGVGLFRVGTGRVGANPGAPIPPDRCPFLESGQISIDRVFRIACTESSKRGT
jgi:hypothetical protein